jgi:3-hydroxy-9,10-secoandrosta-1,3,5(10)-triene-9,17-dione monooxygenase reductase component
MGAEPWVDPYHFRNLCGRFATGVTIVTTTDATGEPAGMTATSFASLSLDPPLVSVNIGHDATIYPAICQATRFAINILEARQEALARRFAASLPQRFDGVGWQRSPDGDVLLDGALAQVCCVRWREFVAGDHTIFAGRVSGGSAAGHGSPLLHYRGGYLDYEP